MILHNPNQSKLRCLQELGISIWVNKLDLPEYAISNNNDNSDNLCIIDDNSKISFLEKIIAALNWDIDNTEIANINKDQLQANINKKNILIFGENIVDISKVNNFQVENLLIVPKLAILENNISAKRDAWQKMQQVFIN